VREKKQKLNFYGRRKGRKLLQGRQAQIQERLPRVLIPICPGEEQLDPMSLFYPPVKDVWMEIGFGAGEHLAYHASTNPDIGFLGIEPFINGVASLLNKMERQDLNNVRLLNDDVRLLLSNLASNSLGRVFILFPDPWPKKKHRRRRLFSNALLDKLSQQMRPHAELRFASDNMCYIRDVLEVVSNRNDFNWEPRRSKDWKKPPSDAIETRYESKARKVGQPCVYLSFRKV